MSINKNNIVLIFIIKRNHFAVDGSKLFFILPGTCNTIFERKDSVFFCTFCIPITN